MNYLHWEHQRDDKNILWLSLNCQESSVNTLNQAVLNEFSHLIQYIKNHPPQAVVLKSSKKDSFIVGADITAFSQLKTEKEALSFICLTQKIFTQWASLPVPTIAMISGICLGGGAELALSCDYRIGEDIKCTQIGFPEVKLGIHPGWGGTIRLPRLIGAFKAIPLMLKGSLLSAKKSQALGILNEAVPTHQLKNAINCYALNPPKQHAARWIEKLSNTALMRYLTVPFMYRKLHKKVHKRHYPAPFNILSNWLQHGVSNNQAMQKEAQSVAKLIFTPASRHLRKIFFLQQQLKSSAKKTSPPSFNHVHVIGAGTMGADIAAWCALKGFFVTIEEKVTQSMGLAIQRAHWLFKKKLKEPRLIQAAMDRLQPDPAGHGTYMADIVIEAIFERLKDKQTLFKSLEPKLKANTLLATNTSSIPLENITTVLNNNHPLIGLHFFNPVASMPLVEVVHNDSTPSETMDNALSFVNKIGKLPLPVKSSPGFLVNRILMPYLMEAVELLNENIPAKTIDQAATNFGMRIGPLCLADTIGLDIILSVSESLSQHLDCMTPVLLQQAVEAGYLGAKNQKGIYAYLKTHTIPRKNKHTMHSKDITDRLILRMANEALMILKEKIVNHSDALDAGMIFGTGFPPFRGGLMEYIKERGFTESYRRLNTLTNRYGDRFKPAPAWREHL